MGSMSDSTRRIVEAAAMSVATSVGFYLMARFTNHRWHLLRLEKEADDLRKLLDYERAERKAERQGRIRAENELRRVQLEMAESSPLQSRKQRSGGKGRQFQPSQTSDSNGQEEQEAEAVSSSGRERPDRSANTAPKAPGMRSYPLKPIGIMHSCFSQRNGTPRQPLLAPLARCRLKLAPDIPADCLEGLQQYSHVWVMYIFHENTDLVKVWQGDRSGLKAKICVPRLNGQKMGVLATRSPHRPSPIGLSVAQVVSVEGNELTLGGADIVDGSPVLDIKPYVPFCDAVAAASAPSWVAAEADEEPLKVSRVEGSGPASELIRGCWAQRRDKSMYRSSGEFLDLVVQVLSRDIRPVHRRIPNPLWANTPAPPPSFYPGTEQTVGLYHVVLEGIDVSYDIDDSGLVVLRGACMNKMQSQQRGLGLLDQGEEDASS